MFLTQLEYREKLTATNWKRITFPLRANLIAEDRALPVRLLHIIAALPSFGRNAQNHGFADAISRLTFRAAHNEFMWFAKSTVKDGNLLIDEEELYNQNSTMLMRRAFAELTIGDAPIEKIPIEQSMLAQHREMDILQKLQQAFERVQFYTATTENKAAVLQQISTAQHGTLILLDGSQLSAPLDLSATTVRNDIQIIATNCAGLPDMTIIKKGNKISCQ